MSGRTPSFIVVGLVIIMFLLALFYTSCSSKNAELRASLEQFEERIRSLTIKNSEADKTIERLTTRKRELEEEISTVRRQMEKKDSEINDINTKLNEKITEIRSLKSDKDVADQQLKDCNGMGETIVSKNSLIERLQQQLNSEKGFAVNEQSRLKQEIETLKNRLVGDQSSQNKQQQNSLEGSNQRFPPLFSSNLTTKSLASLFQDRGENPSNLSREVKPNIIQASIENKENSLNVLGNDTNQLNVVPINQQQSASNNNSNQQLENPNIVAPPIGNVNNDSQHQQGNRVESAQAAPESVQGGDNREKSPDNPQAVRQERGADNEAEKSKVDPAIDDEDEDEMDDEVQVEKNVQSNLIVTSTIPIDGNLLSKDHPSDGGKSLDQHGERKKFSKRRGRLSEKRRFDNGEEAADDDGVHPRGQKRRNNL